MHTKNYKTLLEETKEDLNKCRNPAFMEDLISTSSNTHHVALSAQCNLCQIPTAFSSDIDTPTPKFTWTHKEPRVAKFEKGK